MSSLRSIRSTLRSARSVGDLRASASGTAQVADSSPWSVKLLVALRDDDDRVVRARFADDMAPAAVSGARRGLPRRDPRCASTGAARAAGPGLDEMAVRDSPGPTSPRARSRRRHSECRIKSPPLLRAGGICWLLWLRDYASVVQRTRVKFTRENSQNTFVSTS